MALIFHRKEVNKKFCTRVNLDVVERAMEQAVDILMDDWIERDTPDELAIQMFMNAATLLGQTFLKKAGAFLEDNNDDYEVVRILK